MTMFDKWMYAIKHLGSLMNRPAILQEKVFERLFATAEIAKFNPQERYEYEDSLKAFRDWYSVIETAELRGATKSIKEVALKMKKRGHSIEEIADLTGLSPEEISQL